MESRLKLNKKSTKEFLVSYIQYVTNEDTKYKKN